jgi:aromatic-L-amino-acid decarboxylase
MNQCHWQHPSFYAYFPSNTTFESIIADMYATATSTPGFNHSCNPAATEMEQAMTSWVGQMLGLDRSLSQNGVIQTTASDSAIVATIAARERAIKYLLSQKGSPYKTREEIHSKLVMYGSTQTHSLGAKAGLVLSLPFRAIETYAQDNWALTGASVEKALEEDHAKGLIPFMISGSELSLSSCALALNLPPTSSFNNRYYK